MKISTEKIGTSGTLLAAALCPICFPKLAAISLLFGFSAMFQYELYFFWGAQMLMALALIGQLLAYPRHRNHSLLWLSIGATALFFISLYIWVSEWLSYLALLGMFSASLWSSLENRRRRAQDCNRCASH